MHSKYRQLSALQLQPLSPHKLFITFARKTASVREAHQFIKERCWQKILLRPMLLLDGVGTQTGIWEVDCYEEWDSTIGGLDLGYD